MVFVNILWAYMISRPNFIRQLILAVMFMAGSVSYAADPQSYTVKLDQTSNVELNKVLQDASTLMSLQQSSKVGAFALITRARQDQERFILALRSFAYYQGKAQLRIAKKSLDDSKLLEWLDAAPTEPPVPVTAMFELGPQYHLGKIVIQGDAPEQAHDGLGLQSGQVALATEVLAARGRLLNALRERGYAQAKVGEPVATVQEELGLVDIRFEVEGGPRVMLGHIAINGLKTLKENFIRNRLLIARGQQFQPTAIEIARQDLAALGVFSSVRAQISQQLDPQGFVPVAFEVSERPLHAVNVGAAYSTDLGGSLSSSWLHRNLFGNAEQLNLTAAVTQLGGNSTTGIGYKMAAAFKKPDFLQRDQALQLGLEAIKQSLEAYDQNAVLGELILNRKVSKYWHQSFGITAQQAQITQQNVTRDYTLLGLPLSLKFDSSNSILDPTQGSIATFSVTPLQALAGVNSKAFVVVQALASHYLDLGRTGRSVLALRGAIGEIQGADQFQLPPDKRFYAGGSATVRGYKYQSIGPAFANGKPEGGTAMTAGSVELRQRLRDNYGAVIFVDVGQVSINALPFKGSWQIGAGVGARYYTSFGPIRLDLAVPVNPQPGSGSFEVYIGLGQAF
jgi:translocation and assembly module TamA